MDSTVFDKNSIDKISVIVPVYQAEANLKSCVDSLLAQTYGNFEIILVDDGSRDASPEICDEYSENEIVKVYHQENRGAAAARNFGLNKADGLYVSFVDSDDTVEAEYLSYLKSLIDRTESQIAVCAHDDIYPVGNEGSNELKKSAKEITEGLKRGAADAKDYVNTEVLEKPKASEEIYFYSGNSALEDLLYQRYFMSVPWGMLSERKLWDKVRFPEGTEAEDMGTMYRLFAESDGVVYGCRSMYNYYHRRSNTMNSTKVSRNVAYYKHSRDMLKFVKEKYVLYYPAALSRHFSVCCQILAEVEKTDNELLIKHVRNDIMKLAPKIARDQKCRSQNKSAAVLAMMSVDALKGTLKTYEKGRQLYLD